VAVRTKRVYDPPGRGDGYRVLVDRVWPRGLSRGKADVDQWAKELAPSAELRKWFGHKPERFEEFRRRYRDELRAHEGELDALRTRASKQTVTLLFGARDTEHNNAVVLAEALAAGKKALH
jgi:uncharacterized protein YeaO (DUF488 family)